MTLLPFRHPNEAAAVAQSPSSSASLSQRGRNYIGRSARIAVRATACGLWWIGALLELPFLFARELFGYREYDQQPLYCPDCQDAHGDDEICPRAMVGFCDVCVMTVDLDRFMNCPVSKYHRVLNIRPKTKR